MNKTLISAILITSGVILPSCSEKKNNSTDEVMPVDVATVVTDSVILSDVYPGYLSADRTVDVVARVNGTLLSKNYQSGDFVKQGQTLFIIESTTYRDKVAQAEAALTTARSTYDYAKSHYEAVKKALEADAVSKMEVIQAESAMEQAEASIKNAEAALTTARQMLSYCTVTAPFDGQMSSNNYSVGSYIGGEAQPVTMAVIYDNNPMTVKFSIDDEQYLQLVKGMEAADKVNLDAVPLQFSDTLPHDYTGSLSFISPALNKNTGSLQIECKVENPYGELRPGMFVKVKLPYSRKADAMLVKESAIASDQLGEYLYTVNDSNKVVYSPIQTGDVYNDSMRIVTSGITPGTRYVTKALLKVREGMTVKPVEVK